ncbi:hypothetical protein T07_8635, partial [Trichinella nelsoni]
LYFSYLNFRILFNLYRLFHLLKIIVALITLKVVERFFTSCLSLLYISSHAPRLQKTSHCYMLNNTG